MDSSVTTRSVSAAGALFGGGRWADGLFSKFFVGFRGKVRPRRRSGTQSAGWFLHSLSLHFCLLCKAELEMLYSLSRHPVRDPSQTSNQNVFRRFQKHPLCLVPSHTSSEFPDPEPRLTETQNLKRRQKHPEIPNSKFLNSKFLISACICRCKLGQISIAKNELGVDAAVENKFGVACSVSAASSTIL